MVKKYLNQIIFNVKNQVICLFEEKSKKKFEHNDININYHPDNIKIQNNKDNPHIKSDLKKRKEKNILNKY